MPILLLMAAAAAALPDIVVIARPRPFRAEPVAAVELARMRGGVALPNGLDINVGIDLQTRIDGILVLHSVYISDGASAGLRVFTDGTAPVRTAPSTTSITTTPDDGAPDLFIGRTPTGTTIIPGRAGGPDTINILNADPSLWLNAAGETPVPATPNGPPVTIPPGNVSIRADEGGTVVTLDAPMAQVQQLIGRATGVVIANTGSDRVIDTQSTINVDLKGFSPELTAATFAAERVALEAMRSR